MIRRLETLDGIRGIAILLVLLQHLHVIFFAAFPDLVQRAGRVVGNAGWMGVDVFFVLSGFLITNILLSIRSRPDFWRYFYIRRFYRIVPTVVVCCVPVVWYVVAAHRMPAGPAVLLISPLANWVIIRWKSQYLPHLWSLAVEEQFYFVWPLVVRVVRPAWVFRSAVFIAALSVVLFVTAHQLRFTPDAIYKGTPTHLFGIAFGSALAAALTLGDGVPVLFRSARLLQWAGFLCLVAGQLVGYLFFRELAYSLANPTTMIFGIIGSSLLTAGLILGCVQRSLPGPVQSLLSNPVLRWFGLRSFAMYLIHMNIGGAVREFTSNPTLEFLFVMALSLALSELSWRVVEAPALRIASRLTHRRESMLDA